MKKALMKVLCDGAREDNDIFLLTGDLGFGVLTDFWEEFPNNFLNMGISEQNMTSVGAGLALEGKKVFTYSIGNFPTLRCLEQIRNDVAYHNANVNIISVGAGMSYGPLGMSHHATEDIAIMRALPNMTIFSPADPVETTAIAKAALSISGPCYLRIGKGGEPILHHQPLDFRLGQGYCIKEGKDVAIFSTGAITASALSAAELLGDKCAVYSFPTIKPLDIQFLLSVVKQYKTIFTLEEGNINGGFGSSICEVMSEFIPNIRAIRLGLNDEYCSVVGERTWLCNYYKIDEKNIAKKIEGYI